MSSAFQQRLGAFRQKFQQVVGGRSNQYEELNQLEAPLVGNENAPTPGGDDYFQSHGVPHPSGEAAGRVQQPAISGGSRTNAQVPSQADELRLLAGLANDAAGLLWELAAMKDTGEAASEMLAKSEQLQAQLRGMIGDATAVDETTLAASLQAFTTLENSVAEYHKSSGKVDPSAAVGQATTGVGPHTGASGASTRLTPPPSSSTTQQMAPGSKAAADEPPLISFD